MLKIILFDYILPAGFIYFIANTGGHRVAFLSVGIFLAIKFGCSDVVDAIESAIMRQTVEIRLQTEAIRDQRSTKLESDSDIEAVLREIASSLSEVSHEIKERRYGSDSMSASLDTIANRLEEVDDISKSLWTVAYELQVMRDPDLEPHPFDKDFDED